MAQAAHMMNDRHARMVENVANKRLAATGNGEINICIEFNEFADCFMAAIIELLYRVAGETRRFKGLCNERIQCVIAVACLFSAAHYRCIAAFYCESGDINNDIWPRFKDSCNDTNRKSHSLDPQPVWSHTAFDNLADWIWQLSNGTDTVSNCCH